MIIQQIFKLMLKKKMKVELLVIFNFLVVLEPVMKLLLMQK